MVLADVVPESSQSRGRLEGTLGRYHIDQRIAIGGMAELYLARCKGPLGFVKPVAIKRMRPDLAGDGRAMRMFLDEARLSALLQHPHIVQVFDVTEFDGEHLLAMEYLPGVDARRLIDTVWAPERGGLPVAHAVTIATALASGLHYAHQLRDWDGASLGLVHRDVSPKNVLLGFDGAVKMIDFGIAKCTRATHATEAGGTKGTPSYMSPEQIRAASVDGRSDIFGLGVVLYELLTGINPFASHCPADVFERVLLTTPRAPASVSPEVPHELSELVLRMLRKDPNGRPSSAGQVHDQLEAIARGHRFTLSSNALGQYLCDNFPRPRPFEPLCDPMPGPETGTRSVRLAIAGSTAPVARYSTDAATVPAAMAAPAPRPGNLRRGLVLVTGAALAAAVGLVVASGSGATARAARTAPAKTPTQEPPSVRPALVAAPPSRSSVEPAVPALEPMEPSAAPQSIAASDAASDAESERQARPRVSRRNRSRAHRTTKPVAPATTEPQIDRWDPDSPLLESQQRRRKEEP